MSAPTNNGTEESRDSSFLDAALDSAARGWQVFPVHSIIDGHCTCGDPACKHPGKHPSTAHGFKDATRDPEVIRRWWSEDQPFQPNIGIATGQASNLFVLDVDPRNGGDESLAKLEEKQGRLPDTVEVITGSGGRHFYFKNPGEHISSSTGKLGPGLDIKADGGNVVAPPSLHKSGRHYSWELSSHPDEVELSPLPNWILSLAQEKRSQGGKGSSAGEDIPEGERNSKLASLAGTMRKRGMTEEAILAALLAENAKRCKPPLSEEEVRKIAASISSYAPDADASSSEADEENDNEPAVDPATIAHWIIEEMHQRFARDEGGKLYVFEDGVYHQKGINRVRKWVKRYFLTVGKKQNWSSHKATEVVNFIEADAPELWEAPPLEFVNVLNGILDLRLFLKTGELRNIILLPHTPDHLSPIQIPVKFDPKAVCPTWEAQVLSTFPEDALELAWEILGWLMVPVTSIQRAILLLGEGGTGKSTLLAAIRTFLGRRNVATKSLHRIEANRFSVAGLFGKLANICADLPTHDLASTAMFKSLTGGDEITGEHKFLSEFSFISFARLIFSANRAPKSNDPSEAFFERWIVVPFDRKYRGQEGEIPRQKLDAELADPGELSGALNKALAALPKVLERGFTVSPSMMEAHRRFRESTDPVLVWLQGNVIEFPHAFTSKEDVLAAYNKAAASKGRPVETDKAFSQAIKRWKPDIREGQRTWKGKPKAWCWLGIGLAKDQPPDSPGDYYSHDSQVSEQFTETSDAKEPSHPRANSQDSHDSQGIPQFLNREDPQERPADPCDGSHDSHDSHSISQLSNPPSFDPEGRNIDGSRISSNLRTREKGVNPVNGVNRTDQGLLRGTGTNDLSDEVIKKLARQEDESNELPF